MKQTCYRKTITPIIFSIHNLTSIKHYLAKTKPHPYRNDNVLMTLSTVQFPVKHCLVLLSFKLPLSIVNHTLKTNKELKKCNVGCALYNVQKLFTI